jgi:hypothetical protein
MKRTKKDKFTDKIILAAGSGYGKYQFELIKQQFGEPDNVNTIRDDWELATDTSNEADDWYYEAQWNVIQQAIWMIDNKAYSLCCNQDVWLIPVNSEIPDDWTI